MSPRLARFQDWALLLVRISVGASFIIHGYTKWAIWSAVPEGMPAAMVPLMKLLSVVEPIGGVAVLVGFLTLPAALGLAIIMIGAAVLKVTMMQVPFTAPGGWELDLALFCENVVILTFGAGRFALSKMLGKK